MHELSGEAEPPLEAILARLADCDIILVEGYKRESHQKIETRRSGATVTVPLSASDPNIVAIAADRPQPQESLPVFDLDDVSAIADFIERVTALGR
jgi:molybdopterin-guanine dinucleotide biosynthesis protein B